MIRNSCDVFGLDTREYLESFASSGGLHTADIVSDYRTIATWRQNGTPSPVILVGWSEGAGLALVAAGEP